MEFSTTPGIVGLTGGIGAGKSTVARVFRALGIPVFDADAAGRAVYREDDAVRAAVAGRWGADVLTTDGVDRGKLAARVFGDPAELEALNALVHPAVRERFEAFQRRQVGRAPYVLREAAILFESGADRGCDAVICVEADAAVRLARAAARDRVPLDAVAARAAHQMTDADRRDRCTFILHNGPEDALVPQVLALHRTLCAAAAPGTRPVQ
ncbi:MAG: dephospho-CoA kinase, partial [Flavobacteriales bacterium]